MSFSKYISDTIAAIATPKGKAALAIIRISGSKTFEIIKKIAKISLPPHSWRGKGGGKYNVGATLAVARINKGRGEPYPYDLSTNVKWKYHRMLRATFHHESKVLDEGMLCLFKAPKSFTGEDMAELYCHGNDFIVSQILQCILQHCRLAEKGEFTRRAFLNRKIDLTQAEAIGNLLNAETKKSHEAALLQLEGRLYKKIKSILDKLTELKIIFELAIDFIEDEVPEYNPLAVENKINSILNELKTLIDTGQDGIIITEGIKVCLIGAPNVGKSSIFNAFLETERAIITPIPGTTRDYLEEAFSLDGYKIRLFDTAGIHESDDPIEKIGIERSKKLIQEVDLVFYISDPSIEENVNQYHLNCIPKGKVIKVLNKADLLKPYSPHIHGDTSSSPHIHGGGKGGDSTDAFMLSVGSQEERFEVPQICTDGTHKCVPYSHMGEEHKGYTPCSTKTKDGLEPLKKELLSRFKNIDEEMESGIITNTRQFSAVKNAFHHLSKAKESFQSDIGVDFIAFDIQQASSFIEEIIGKISPEDVLEKIFENFCIGK